MIHELHLNKLLKSQKMSVRNKQLENLMEKNLIHKINRIWKTNCTKSLFRKLQH